MPITRHDGSLPVVRSSPSAHRGSAAARRAPGRRSARRGPRREGSDRRAARSDRRSPWLGHRRGARPGACRPERARLRRPRHRHAREPGRAGALRQAGALLPLRAARGPGRADGARRGLGSHVALARRLAERDRPRGPGRSRHGNRRRACPRGHRPRRSGANPAAAARPARRLARPRSARRGLGRAAPAPERRASGADRRARAGARGRSRGDARARGRRGRHLAAGPRAFVARRWHRPAVETAPDHTEATELHRPDGRDSENEPEDSELEQHEALPALDELDRSKCRRSKSVCPPG